MLIFECSLQTHLLAVCLCINGNAAKPVAKSYASDYRYIYNPAGAGGRLQSPVYVKDQPEAVAGGRYSYVDGNGVIQTTQYISDVLGFKAAAPNAPQEVVQYSEATVKAVPVQQVIAARGQEGQKEQSPAVLVPAVSYSYLPYATNFAYYFTPGTQAAVQEPNVAVSEPGQTVQEAYNLPDHSQIPAAAVVAAPPVLTQSQFHARDELGQYQFGYSDPNSARIETKTADGVVRGSYNYVDDQGKIQTVQYVADALGFRAGGTAFPVVTYEAQPAVQDTPEVIAARKQHAELFAEIQARDEELRDIAEEMAQANQPVVLVDPAEAELGPSVHSLPTNDEDDVPLLEEKEFVIDIRGGDPIADAEEPHTRKVEETNAALVVEAPVPALVPEANPAGLVGSPVAAPSSGQHHAQDELGQYNYGYTSPDSSKVETKTVDGTVRGAYNYIDSNGMLGFISFLQCLKMRDKAVGAHEEDSSKLHLFTLIRVQNQFIDQHLLSLPTLQHPSSYLILHCSPRFLLGPKCSAHIIT